MCLQIFTKIRYAPGGAAAGGSSHEYSATGFRHRRLLPSINMHIHTSTSSTYFFLTNKQTNNTWVWFWRIFDTTHFQIPARIGPSAYSGPEPGGTMVNGILAFSPIRIPSAIASPSPLLSHLTQTIRGISSHLQDFVLPWLRLQYIAILCWGSLIQYILVCSDTVRLSDAIWGQLMKRWFCPID